MSKWDIDPAGVSTVLTDVGTQADALSTALNGLETPFTNGVTATASAAIGEAIGGYFEMEGPRISGMSTRISAACEGVVNATKAYLAGDEQMAADAQAASVAKVTP